MYFGYDKIQVAVFSYNTHPWYFHPYVFNREKTTLINKNSLANSGQLKRGTSFGDITIKPFDSLESREHPRRHDDEVSSTLSAFFCKTFLILFVQE